MSTELGRRIEDQRLDRGLTRPDLGRLLGYDPDRVYGWERRGKAPSPVARRQLEKLGFVLDGEERVAA